jgi:hypothetical protein
MTIPLLLLASLLSCSAWAYPEFIGYKYSSCLTCHFNGNGGGPLSDYGRALWSAEIAGRWLSHGKTEDQLSQSSGFLGSKPLPWWVRPGFKTRYLEVRGNPGGSGGISQSILMQMDLNLALFFDKDQKYAFVGSYGFAPQPLRLQNKFNAEKLKDWISREHYFRWQAKDSLWVYIGMMDKPFGIRQVDHTAFSREKTGVAQNDQSHGILVQTVKEKYEWSVNAFAGNLYQSADLRQVGASTLYEYEILPAQRIGASALASTNKYLKEERLAVHFRRGLGYGSALLLELGLIRNTPKGATAQLGYYSYAEAIQRMIRGYHLFVSGQSYQQQLKASQEDQFRFDFGFLMFPMARTEFRLQLENARSFSDSADVGRESWAALAQVHLSL